MAKVNMSALKEDPPKHTVPPGYAVNKDGTVVSFIPWRGSVSRELKQSPDQDGYMTVRVVWPNGKRAKLRVHRLVAAYWIGPRPSMAHEIRHLDGNKLNNHASNLAWGTRKQNAEDRDVHGRTSRGLAHSKAIKASNQAAATREFRAKQRMLSNV